MTKELAKTDQPELQQSDPNAKPEVASFTDSRNFELAQRMAKALAASTMIPKEYQGNIPNTMIALEMSNRIGASPLMVMQNLHIINGRPSWSSPFIIAVLNNCKRFTKLNFKKSGEGEDYGYEAYAHDRNTKELLEGPKITWRMVKEEGWYAKAGSKWKTMSELMFRYRAAAFFGRLHAPDILMGMLTVEESADIQDTGFESIDHIEIMEIPDLLKDVIKETNEDSKLSEIYRNNPEYHSNPEFMKILTNRKKEINANSNAGTV